jgi:hypothetical protein
LHAETVPRVKPADAKNAVAAVHLAQLVSLDSPDAPATPELPVFLVLQESRFLLLASNLQCLHANHAPAVNLASQDPQARLDSQELQDNQASPVETHSQAHQALQDPQDSPDSQEGPDSQETLVLQRQAKLLHHHHQAHLESRDPQASLDTQEDPDNPVALDSPDQRDPLAHLDSPEATANPVSQETPVSPVAPVAPESAQNIALWMVVFSSPTVLDVLKRPIRRKNDKIKNEIRRRSLFSPTTTKFYAFITAATRIMFLSNKKLPFSP